MKNRGTFSLTFFLLFTVSINAYSNLNSIDSLIQNSSPYTHIQHEQKKNLEELFNIKEEAKKYFEKEAQSQTQAPILRNKTLENLVYIHRNPNGEKTIVKLRRLGQHLVYRILPHFDPETAYIFLISPEEQKLIQKNHNLLKKIIAYEHLEAGTHRSERRWGRNVVLVFNKDTTALLEKPSRMSLQNMKNHFLANYEPPSKELINPTLISILMYTSITALSGAVKLASENAEFSQELLYFYLLYPSLIQIGFVATLGIFFKTYKNFVYKIPHKAESHLSHRFKEILRASVISALFAYSMSITFNQGTAHLTVLSLTGLLAHAHVLFNVFLSNISRTEGAQWARVLDVAGKDLGQYHIKIPFTKKSLNLNKKFTNYSLISVAPYHVLRTMDLAGVPFATALFASFPFAVKYGIHKWAKAYHPKASQKLKLSENFDQIAEFRKKILTPFSRKMSCRALFSH